MHIVHMLGNQYITCLLDYIKVYPCPLTCVSVYG